MLVSQEDPKPLPPPYTLVMGNQPLSPSLVRRRLCVLSPPLFPFFPRPCMLTLGDGQLVEPDVVHDRLHLPVLQEGVPGHLTEVHHPCQRKDMGA